MTKPTLSFIGAGTLGTALSKACASAGYRVLSIHSRTFENAARLAGSLPQAEAVPHPSDATNADVTFLTVPDDAIAAVCEAWLGRPLPVSCIAVVPCHSMS